jgi:hypothetical protein
VVGVTEADGTALPLEAGLNEMCDVARRRAILGLQNGITGVIAADEELLLKKGESLPGISSGKTQPAADDAADLSIDLATLLQWIKEGKEDQVIAHIGKLSSELQPLVDLLLKQHKL